jgi:hypothetical protein
MKKLETQQEILKKPEEQKQWESQIKKAFEAGVEFVYKKYPFLEDAVSERLKNDDYKWFSEVVSIDEDTGCPEWDEGKWDYGVDEAVAELISNNPELKEKRNICECDCEACFSCEHQGSGVIIEREEN